jgi:hypothetical protein
VDWTLFNAKVSQDALDDTASALRALITAGLGNIYTSNGTLTGNRAVTLGGFNLRINGAVSGSNTNGTWYYPTYTGGQYVNSSGMGTYWDTDHETGYEINSKDNTGSTSYATLKTYNRAGLTFAAVRTNIAGILARAQADSSGASLGVSVSSSDFLGLRVGNNQLIKITGYTPAGTAGTDSVLGKNAFGEIVALPPTAGGGSSLPSQTGNAGKVLTTDGTTASWANPSISTSSATSLTLSTTETYVFTGSSATTWTLPAISGDTGRRYFIKNRGTANITLQRAGSDQLYNTSAVNSITILPGGSFIVQNDGTVWIVMG